MPLTPSDYQAPSMVDPYSKGSVGIDTLHYNIHIGNAFQAYHVKEGLIDGSSEDVLIEVGDKNPHLAFLVSHTASCQARLFEDADATTGNAITERNRKRLDNDDSGHTISSAPSITSTGTEIEALILPGGNKNSAIGAFSSSHSEYILKANSNYLLRVTNNSGADISITMAVEFYNI